MHRLPGQWERRPRGSPWPALTPLSSHVPLSQARGKEGLIGRRRDWRRKKEERGGPRRWREVGLLSVTAGGRMCPDPRGEACFVCVPTLQGIRTRLWLRRNNGGIGAAGKRTETICLQGTWRKIWFLSKKWKMSRCVFKKITYKDALSCKENANKGIYALGLQQDTWKLWKRFARTLGVKSGRVSFSLDS